MKSEKWISNLDHIAIKPDSEVDPAKESDLGLHGLTRLNPNQLKKIKKIKIKFLYFI